MTLECRDLVVEYSGGGYVVRPIDGLSLEVARGELVLLLGASGCGKTTLLSILAGILRPQLGQVRLNDRELTRLTGGALTDYRRHSVGVVFQAFNLVSTLTAEQNVALPARLAGTRLPRSVVRDVLQRVGLEQRRGHRPAQLSGGQQQRVAIARALVSKPTVVFADEPTGNLDSSTSAEILELLRHSVDAYGQTTVMVTHDANAAAIADRILFLADGRIVKDLGPSSTKEILDAMEEVTAL
jgi:putative ABC transport system ATP-binding protein